MFSFTIVLPVIEPWPMKNNPEIIARVPIPVTIFFDWKNFEIELDFFSSFFFAIFYLALIFRDSHFKFGFHFAQPEDPPYLDTEFPNISLKIKFIL